MKYDAIVWKGVSEDGVVMNEGGPPVFKTIQAAVNHCALHGGGTVLLKPGEYVEDVSMPSDVSVVGEDINTTTWKDSEIKRQDQP